MTSAEFFCFFGSKGEKPALFVGLSPPPLLKEIGSFAVARNNITGNKGPTTFLYIARCGSFRPETSEGTPGFYTWVF